MAGPGCRLLRLARVTLALTANCAAVTGASAGLTTLAPSTTAGTDRAPNSSRLAAVLAPCMVALAIVAILGLALAAVKLRETWQTELTSEDLTSDLLLPVSLASVVLLLVLILTSVGLAAALNRRATHGTYSPSRQEKDGSRVEMWSLARPPPVERLI